MFNKLMNSYFYGKAGKGDFTPDDLPENRWQLFLATLRVRLSALVRLNLMYFIVWLPLIIVLSIGFMSSVSILQSTDIGDGKSLYMMQAEMQAADAQQGEETVDPETLQVFSQAEAREQLQSVLFMTLLLMIPCIAITGPATVGVAYVTRNWSRDEHAFIWSDFKDAAKENWKQSVVISTITGIVPFIVYMCWRFYGTMASTNVIMILPQVLILMLGLIWALAVTYMHPMLVSYQLKMKDLLRNALMLAVARLPMSVGIRVLHCIPLILGFLAAFLWQPAYAYMILVVYYLIIGFSLSRFVTASYTNGVFDKYINSRIEGAKVNRGLREADDDDDYEDDEEDAE